MHKRPNILMITCHDLGQHLGCYGHDTVYSPALDELVAEGVRFENSFCTAPQCSPSRASLHTGRYPHATGMMGLTNLGWEINPDERHIAMLLRQAGYETALFGVQHVTSRPESLGYDAIGPLFSGPKLGGAAAEFLRRPERKGRPFYLEVGFYETHRPFNWQGAELYDELGVEVPPYLPDCPEARDEFARLQGDIKTLDRGVGFLLHALRDASLEEDTWVIFVADHGLAMPRAKCTLYDPGLEVALLMRWPAGRLYGGSVYSELVSNVDLVPTVLDGVGLQHPENLHGRSLLPLLRGEEYQSRDAIFAEKTFHTYYDPMRAIRTGTHKLILNLAISPRVEIPEDIGASQLSQAIATRFMGSRTPIELYDLQNDPWEQTSLVGKEAYADLESELKARLLAWMSETYDPILQGPVDSPFSQIALEELRSLP